MSLTKPSTQYPENSPASRNLTFSSQSCFIVRHFSGKVMPLFMMHCGRKMKKIQTSSAQNTGYSKREHRWCERHKYFIDIEACKARSVRQPYCRRCLIEWRQLVFPFYEL